MLGKGEMSSSICANSSTIRVHCDEIIAVAHVVAHSCRRLHLFKSGPGRVGIAITRSGDAAFVGVRLQWIPQALIETIYNVTLVYLVKP